MIEKIKYYLLFVSFLFVSGVALSYPNTISITPIPLIEQLPSNTVLRVYQDKEGFMWFGTLDGLCRYDGYRVLVFRSNLNNPNLLSNNEITCFAESGDKYLWVGTRKGINILNKKTYQIIHFNDSEIQEQEIRCITTTKDGTVWVGTNSSLYRYDNKLNRLKKYQSELPAASVNFIYEDTDGNVWIALWGGGLYKYNLAGNTFIPYPTIGVNNNPFKLFQDNRGVYWLCTWGDGVYLFNPQSDESQMYTKINVHSANKQYSERQFFSITQDDKYGYIWLMCISGLYALEYNNDNTFTEVDISPLFKESNNIFSEIVKDKVGNLWIGAFSEGVLTINFNKPVIRNYTMPAIKEKTGITPNITTIYQDDDGCIWLNQNRRGLTFFDPVANTIRFYEEYPALRSLPGMSIISCIGSFKAVPNEVWLAPESEPLIYCVKKEKQQISLQKRIDLSKISTNSGNPRFFFEDSKNNIWIVTTTGLFVKPVNNDSIKPVGFSLRSVTGITEDTDGRIWISTKNSGIYQISVPHNLTSGDFNIKNFDKSTGLITDNIETICADTTGKIWIGSKEGNVIVYNITEGEFIDYSKKIGKIGEGILNIVTDNFGHIWISTNKRVIEYKPTSGALRDYSGADGVLVNSFFQDACFKDKLGNIFFGGNKGISIFTPSEKMVERNPNILVYVTDIKINNQSVFYDNNNRQFDVVSQTITFNADDKNIEIDFSSMDYTNPSKIRYAYKMEGVDDDWIYAEENRQFAIYNQLPKGSHTFYLKATDENKQWSTEVKKIKIYKRPAFYETWWAYTFYVTLFFGFIYMAYRIVKNRIKLRNKLKIAQIEKDKSEELTQAKLRYFTNISHDFLTPLTIISCLIDDAEITYNNKNIQYGTMRSNVNRLRRLLQQVLDFRKVESGKMKLRILYGDVVVFIKDVCYTHFLPLMKKKNINFTFNATPNQIQAYFDADKIDKIVFNLLSNAFKYTDHNGSVGLELSLVKKNGALFLHIKISDTGVGIPPEDLNNIFTRFYSNKISEASESNGIGLSLTKDLVELHHGTIWAESRVGEGTIFNVEIPIDRGHYAESEIVKSEQIVGQNNDMVFLSAKLDTVDEITEDSKLKKENTTILVVEDNEELLTLISNILAKRYNVFTAINGVQACDMVKQHDIGIIISDVMMPEMDGHELCKTLKSDLETSHIPIILLTAKNSTDDRIACYNAGADGYISKPFDLKVLEARINNFISNKRNKQQEFKADVEINISKLEYPSIDEQFLNNAVAIIEKHLAETEFDVNTFAQSLNMSKSSLYRKIKTMTGLSPIEFIRNIRLKHACLMLRDQSVPIAEVAYAVGFSDPKYFTSCFKSEFDVTPSDYQKQQS